MSQKLAILLTIFALSAAATTEAGTQDAEGPGLAETLAELDGLGLRVEVRAAEPTGLQPALALPAGAGVASQPWWDGLVSLLDQLFSGHAERLRDATVAAIRDACRINRININEAAPGGGFKLESVAISFGGGVGVTGGVTATFTPEAQFCSQVLEASQD